MSIRPVFTLEYAWYITRSGVGRGGLLRVIASSDRFRIRGLGGLAGFAFHFSRVQWQSAVLGLLGDTPARSYLRSIHLRTCFG